MKWLKFLVLFLALTFVGCGGGPAAGTPGDENDPAAAGGSDEEQMADETGEMTPE